MKTIKHKAFGEEKTIKEWARKYGMSTSCLDRRRRKFGNLEKALLEPKPKSHTKPEYIGKIFHGTVLVNDIFKENGITLFVCQCLQASRDTICNKIFKIKPPVLTSGNTRSCGCFGKISHSNGGYKKIYGSYFNRLKHRAKSNKLEFAITIEYIWELFLKQKEKCKFSGVNLTFSTKSVGTDGTASLDRIDSNIGYIPSNVQWVHKWVNNMKMDFTDDEFIDWFEKIYKNSLNK